MRTLATLATSAAIAVLGVSASAYADPNPHNNSCQAVETGMPPGNTPGNAATSPGSVFNEPAFNSTLGGTGGQAYNKPHQGGGIAQYDTACANTLKTGTGTPMQPPSALQPTITNNALDTRVDAGVVSHTGNGP